MAIKCTGLTEGLKNGSNRSHSASGGQLHAGGEASDPSTCSNRVGRSGPNLEPGTMRVYVTNGPRNGLKIGRKVGPSPGSQRRWVLGSVHAFSQAVHAANTYRPRFQVKTRPS